MKNRLKYWRHQLQIDSKKEFAKLLGLSNYNQYVRWENQKVQPDLDSLYYIWRKLKKHIPMLNLQDLIDPE